MSHINKMLFDLKLNECKKKFFCCCKKKKFGVILTKLMNKKVQKIIAQTYVN